MGGNQLTFDNFGALMPYPMLLYQCLWMTIINGNSRILKWRYVSTIFQAIVWGYIPLHSPYIGLICSRYRHFRILEFPLTLPITLPWYDGCDPNNLTITNGAFREKQILELASGKLTVCYWKWSIYSGFTHNKMVILQGYYVSLPEGQWSFFPAAPGPLFVAEVPPRSSASPRPQPTYQRPTAVQCDFWPSEFKHGISMDIKRYQVILQSLRTERHICFWTHNV